MKPARDQLQAPGYQVGTGALEVFSQLAQLDKGMVQAGRGGRRIRNQWCRRRRRQRDHNLGDWELLSLGNLSDSIKRRHLQS